MIALYWPCEACGHDVGMYAHAGALICGFCKDELGIPTPGSTDNSPDWFGVPGGAGMDRARDRHEEDSLGLP